MSRSSSRPPSSALEPLRKWRGLWRRPGVRLGVLLVAVPAVMFGLPAALGRPWLVGDNLIQNYPLRVLTGTDLMHGHPPLWNPYVWSGTPLLAGFNAGAAYPLSWLFAVLPHALAWVSNQVAVEVVAATGMVTLLRRQGRSWGAATLGAVAFSYGGFVAMQSVHIDVVQAAGWLVWAFVALDGLARRRAGTSGAPWVALLGAALGLMVLSGAVEPVLDGGVALVVYALWLLWRAKGRRVVLALQAIAGVGLGLMVGAAQLLPGSALQGQSQRAAHSYLYFTSGSMNKSLTLLGLDPLVLGGGHSWPLSFVGTYNLPEISSYIGILPVMGVVGLLARRHRRSAEAREWWIWYVIGALGFLLAWGSFTPLAHIEHLIPFYNRQRLLARNVLEVDLAAAVLFAAWVDHMLLSPRRALGAAPGAETDSTVVSDHGPGRRRRWSSDVVLPLLPPIAVVGLQVVILAGGPWFPHFLHVPGPVSYGRLWPLGLFLSVPSAVAVAAAWLVVRRPSPRRVTTAVLAGCVLAVDLVVFNVVAQVYPQTTNAASQSPTADALVAAVAATGTGPGGLEHRMALFDPDRFHPNEVNAIGQPDLNVLRGLSSVQGYGAVVDARYDTATGAHLQGNLSLDALRSGTLTGLDLGVLVTAPEYFVHLVVAPPTAPNATTEGATPLPPFPPDRSAPGSPLVAPPTSPGDYLEVPPPAPTVTLQAGRSTTFYFGTVLAVRAVDLPVTVAPGAGGAAGPARLRVGLLSADGTGVQWQQTVTVAGAARTAAVTRQVKVRVDGAPDAAGLVLSTVAGAADQSPLSVGAALVSTAGQGTYRVDGSLRDVVSAPQWRFAGRIGVFAVFGANHPSGRAWVEPAASGTARIVYSPPWGTERVEVRADAPVTLVRNEAFAKGWQAAITPGPGRSGPTRTVPVVRHGLVQAVTVPAGTYVVTFRYRAHRVLEGLVLSGIGVLLAVALVIVGRRGVGLRRRGPGARSAAAGSARGPDDAGRVPAPSAPGPAALGPRPRGP